MQLFKTTKEAKVQLNKKGTTNFMFKPDFSALSRLRYSLFSSVSSVYEPDVSGISDDEPAKKGSGKKWEKPAEPVKPSDGSQREVISAKLRTADEVLLQDYPWKEEELLENKRLRDKEMFQREWEHWEQKIAEAKEQLCQILQKEELERTKGVLRHRRQDGEVKEAESKLKTLEVEEQAALTKEVIAAKLRTTSKEAIVLLRAYRRKQEELWEEQRFVVREMFQREWEFLRWKVPGASEKPRQILEAEEESKRNVGALRYRRQSEVLKEAESKLKRLEVEEQAAQTKKAELRTADEEDRVLLQAYRRKQEELLERERMFEVEMFRRERELWRQVAIGPLEKHSQVLQEEELKRTEGVLRDRRQGEEAKEAGSKLKRLEVEEEATQNKKAEDSKDTTASKIVTGEGATLSVKGVNMICPPGAVEDPVSIRLTLEEPYRYCYLTARCGLLNDVSFVAPIVNCQPNGQKFEKYVTLEVKLNGKRVKSDSDLLVLHGTRTGQSQMINWEDITNLSKFDLQTKKLEVRINQFSLIAVLARLTLVRTKEIVTRLNLMPFKYNLSVLFKLNQQQSPFDELALVFMSQDTYQEEYYRDHEDSAIMRLKKDGFEELPIDSKNAQESICIYNKEIMTISVQLGEDYKPANNQQVCFEVVVDSSAWWNTGHVIKLPLQVCNTNSKIVCGKILVKGEFGHVRENKFCQQDLCGYVRHVLGVKRAIFDVKAVAQKLELPTETQRQVLTCWQSEAKQLELLLLHWRQKHGDAANPNHLKKALEELEPEEYKVKERGQMHIDHLRELAFKIAGLQHHDTDVMKYFDREVEKLCSAVLRDCCIENATSKEEVESAIQTENFASVLVMKKRLPESVGKTCTRMFSSQEDEFNTSSFLCIVSELIQCIKEIFREEKIQRTLSGLRGVTEEATLQKITSGIRDAAYDKSIFKLLSEVCHILEILCRNNNDDRQRESRIQSWGSCAMMAVMLHFLERFFQCAEACRLYRRLKLFSFSIRDIMSNPTAYEGSFLRDFHNVAVSLLKFARFDPSHLVQFELKDPNDSINNQTKDDIKYDTSKEMFSQLFWMIKKCEENLQLEATAHVHVGGQLLTLGAFEAMVILPESFSEVVENAPIASFPVSFKSETDGESSNLRVTLYSTQKDNIGKALEYLQDALDGQLSLSKQTEIKETSLKLLNVAKAGTDVRLRLTHIWGSGTLGVESNTFVPLGYSSPEAHNNLEITDEPDQQAVGESSLLPVAGTSEYIADNHNRGNDFMTGPSSAELIPSSTSTTRPTVINVNNYINQTYNMEGHVCVAGEKPNLNVQSPSSAAQRFLEAGPGAATNRSITAGDS